MDSSASENLVFRVHAIQRMFSRGIIEDIVRRALETAQTLQEYPDDQPYPSRLVLGWHGTQPIHMVIALNEDENQVIVITVYEPDPAEWGSDFSRRIL